MKSLKSSVYDIFKIKTSNDKYAFNDILKGTKSVLASRQGYESYIHDYFLSTKMCTFKSPEITEYPLLKTDSSFLIPINTIKFKDNNTKKKIIKNNNLLLETEFFQKNNNNYLDDFNKRLNKLVKEEKKINKAYSNKPLLKKKERYNPLFLDFFSKWKDEKSEINLKYMLGQDKSSETKIRNEKPVFNFNIKERYEGLLYNENEIFNSNYDEFILNRLNISKKNKIKNFTSEIKSSFFDSSNKKIKIKLESIKLTFNPTNKDDNNYKSFCIFIPLSYVFLFYSYDFSFFQKILISLLKFDKNYKTINFKADGFIDLLNSLNIETNKQDKVNDEDLLSTFKKGQHSTEMIKNYSPIKNIDYDMRKTYTKQFNLGNKFMRRPSNLFENGFIKTKIIHSNKKFNIVKIKNTENSEKEKENNLIHSNSDKNNISYNIYYFIWETSVVTYDIKLEMPKIYFSYQNFDYNLIAFCEKNLFLYLYKNNFINWDFYALNYLFSFKYFRKLILNFFSLNKSSSFLENQIFGNINKKVPIFKKNIKLDLEEDNINNDRKDNKDIIISNEKILNQMSENNESYMFFYTDQNYDNYIINLYSYKIKIQHEKLNPKLNWEFILNFKQMKFLNEVSKYENLITFLPKIIITKKEIGDLDINFDIFYNNFDATILQNEAGHNKMKKKNLNIEVYKPHIESFKIDGNEEKKNNKELKDNLLQKLNAIKMKNWSRKILGIMQKDFFYKSHRASGVYTKNCQFLKDDNLKNDIFKKVIDNKRSKKKLTFFGGYKNKNIDIEG